MRYTLLALLGLALAASAAFAGPTTLADEGRSASHSLNSYRSVQYQTTRKPLKSLRSMERLKHYHRGLSMNTDRDGARG